MKKKLVIFFIIFFTGTAGYLVLRFYFLKSPDFKADLSKSRSFIDLRPTIIAKLRQMVKDGSNGLYKLSIGDIEPDLLASQLTITNATLVVDSLVLKRFDSMHLAPDDVFHISFRSLHISGISITDLLSTKAINLQTILITDPAIETYRKERKYNKKKRAHTDSLTLYQRLTSHTKSISVDTIMVKRGSFASFNLSHKNKGTKLDQLSIRMDGLLIDSGTQFDTHRFFFAKAVTISCGHLLRRTADSLYFIKADALSVSAPQNTMTVHNLSLIPRGDKKEFQKKLVYRSDRFDITLPKVTFKNINWWSLANQKSFECDEADTYNGTVYDYVNDSLPSKPKIRIANFPLQLIMQLGMPLFIKKMNVHHLDFLYEEYYPPSGKTGGLV